MIFFIDIVHNRPRPIGNLRVILASSDGFPIGGSRPQPGGSFYPKSWVEALSLPNSNGIGYGFPIGGSRPQPGGSFYPASWMEALSFPYSKMIRYFFFPSDDLHYFADGFPH